MLDGVPERALLITLFEKHQRIHNASTHRVFDV